MASQRMTTKLILRCPRKKDILHVRYWFGINCSPENYLYQKAISRSIIFLHTLVATIRSCEETLSLSLGTESEAYLRI